MMQPRRPHRQPNHKSKSQRWARRTCRDPHNGQQHHHQWGNLAGEWTSQQYSMPTDRAWRHTEAVRHQPLANLVLNLKNQCRTPGVWPASPNHQPMGHNPQVARMPPPWRTQRITPTQAHLGRRRHRTHLEPAQSQRPEKPHPTRRNARPAEKLRPANTTATKTLSMPSWGPAWVTPTQLQRRRHHASARSNDATIRRADPSRCHARHTSSAITPPWGAPSMLPLQVTGMWPRAEQRTNPGRTRRPRKRGAREASTNTASEPTGPPPGTAPPWRRGNLDYARLEGNSSRPSNQAEQAAAQDLGLWINRLTEEEQSALAVRIRWLLTLRSRHLAEGTRTMADITFGHWTGHTTPATMNNPGQWHSVATGLMAHMGAYSPDEINELHWQWHQRAALCIRTAMQQHDIWDIPGSPGYRGHASGHRRPRSQDIPEPPRQAARRNSPERRGGPPAGMGSPSGTYRSPLRPFAPRRGPGSPHTSGSQGGTSEQR